MAKNERFTGSTWGHYASRAVELDLCEPTVQAVSDFLEIDTDQLDDDHIPFPFEVGRQEHDLDLYRGHFIGRRRERYEEAAVDEVVDLSNNVDGVTEAWKIDDEMALVRVDSAKALTDGLVAMMHTWPGDRALLNELINRQVHNRWLYEPQEGVEMTDVTLGEFTSTMLDHLVTEGGDSRDTFVDVDLSQAGPTDIAHALVSATDYQPVETSWNDMVWVKGLQATVDSAIGEAERNCVDTKNIPANQLPISVEGAMSSEFRNEAYVAAASQAEADWNALHDMVLRPISTELS